MKDTRFQSEEATPSVDPTGFVNDDIGAEVVTLAMPASPAGTVTIPVSWLDSLPDRLNRMRVLPIPHRSWGIDVPSSMTVEQFQTFLDDPDGSGYHFTLDGRIRARPRDSYTGFKAGTRAEVAHALRIDPRTLDGLVQRASAAGITPPFLYASASSRRRQIWNLRRLPVWFEEVARWQASEQAAHSVQAGGSSARSSTRSPSGRSGNKKGGPSPLEFAKSLVSKG